MQMFDRASRGFLKAGEVESVFRSALDEEPRQARATRLDSGMRAGLDRRPLRSLETTYRVAARRPADANSVPSDLIDELADGFSAQDRAAVVLMLESLAPHRSA
ncbi:hypothetical protein [Sphingomonas sp. Leaf62]|uniref:hypothetical protein n=1 Tax=Sphingomonas sp. Leaf62 TaxID=1736228 RepID=UPI0006FD171D|nr:hypothetical protein [Sphingomonas sp. Leaf62]KQN78854.1 hypothetical protein ASE91_13235 [Sphingomonas sp. Leaf62]